MRADVEAESITGMSSLPILTQRTAGNEDCGNFNASHNLNVSCSRSSDSHGQKSGISNAESSDSEDDLNIVLNDEDCKEFQVAAVKSSASVRTELDKNVIDRMVDFHVEDEGSVLIGYHTSPDFQKKTRPCRSSFSNNERFNELPGMTSCSSIYARLDGNDIGEQLHAMDKRVRPHGERPHYSLPRNRTIFDVNIDEVFEKRWRYPGVDLSDFFNFGLNEDSWRRYCILLADWRTRFQ